MTNNFLAWKEYISSLKCKIKDVSKQKQTFYMYNILYACLTTKVEAKMLRVKAYAWTSEYMNGLM